MKTRARPQRTEPARSGPPTDWTGDRGGLVSYLSRISSDRGLTSAAVAKAMKLKSAQHLNLIRRGETPLRTYAERWAHVVGVDLEDPEVLRYCWEEFQDAIRERLSDSQATGHDKVLFLDDLLRSLEKDVPVRVEPIFDFVAECISRSPRPVYVVHDPRDFPPVGSNPYRYRTPR